MFLINLPIIKMLNVLINLKAIVTMFKVIRDLSPSPPKMRNLKIKIILQYIHITNV